MSANTDVPAVETPYKTRYNPWLIAVTVTMATFMEVLDTSIANVALPHMAGSLSVSTEDYDRGTKFTNYRTIPSLRDYVLISTDQILVEYYTRREDASWVLRELKAGARFKLESVGCEIAVDELYLKVFAG